MGDRAPAATRQAKGGTVRVSGGRKGKASTAARVATKSGKPAKKTAPVKKIPTFGRFKKKR